MNDNKTTLLNAAVIAFYGYHLPVAVVFGSFIGASLFILSCHSYGKLTKAYFFLVSFLCGIFAHENVAGLISLIMPRFMDANINDFLGAVLCAAFAIKAIIKIDWCIDNRTLSFWKTGGQS